jgi:hypothetical protein
MVSYVLRYYQMLLYVLIDYHILSYVIIYYHILSYIIIYYHILSYIIIYYHLLPYIIIYYHLLSYIINIYIYIINMFLAIISLTWNKWGGNPPALTRPYGPLGDESQRCWGPWVDGWRSIDQTWGFHKWWYIWLIPPIWEWFVPTIYGEMMISDDD